MRARSWLLPLLCSVVLGSLGCGEKAGTFVLLKFSGTVTPGVPIKTIAVDLTMGAESNSTAFTTAAPEGITLPNDASLTIHHGEGDLVVTARALAADGNTVLGTGKNHGLVTRDKTAEIQIIFSPGAGVVDGGVAVDGGDDHDAGDVGGQFDAGIDRANDGVQVDARQVDGAVDGGMVSVDAITLQDALDAPQGAGGTSGADGGPIGGETGTGGSGGGPGTGGSSATGGSVLGGAPGPDAAAGADAAGGGGAGAGGTTVTGGTTMTGGSTVTGGSSSVPAPHVVELASSDNATCARKSDGTIWCWGQAFHPTETIDPVEYQTGMLGPVTTDTATPVKIPGVASAFSMAGGLYHACYLKSDQTVACWGRNQLGQIGNGLASTTEVTTASPVPGITTAMAVGAGSAHSCALLSSGRVVCWGSNENGTLGNSTIGVTATDYSPTPVEVSGVISATALATSYGHSCALRSNGKVWCWGNNDRYQLGLNQTSPKYSVTPVEVSGISGAKAIVVGSLHSCALLTDKTVWCWGRNKLGTLGDGKGDGTEDNNTPTPGPVSGITTAKALFSGASHTCAILEDSTVMCWGFNNNGRLGDGTTVTKYSPVPVVLNFAGDPLSGVSALDLGGTTTCALKTDRSVYCWGRGLFAANGDPAKADRLYPVLIPAF